MPIYDLKCEDCGEKFDVRASLEEKEKKKDAKFNCPACGSKKTAFKFNVFSFFRKEPVSKCSCSCEDKDNRCCGG
ncbi:MAG: FmdB family zinc ribbon protein [Candidatus Margulisiibacteriota bacterium]|nr:hypothetical protein [Candidatus Margulisiibacteriota bacterium]